MGTSWKRAIVVGASSGIGEAVARRLATEGVEVALVARRKEALEAVAASIRESGGKARVYSHDVCRFDEAAETFDRIVRDLGGLDFFCYASGVMPGVVESEYDFEKDRSMIEVNVLGAMAWLNPVAALFEGQRGGTIVGISSIAGERGRRGAPGYCTSKAALTAYLEALRNRLTRYGVSVCTIKPGFIDTAMTQGLEGLFWLKTPDEAAFQIVKLARKRSASGFVPTRWALVAFVVRNVPSFLFRRTNI